MSKQSKTANGQAIEPLQFALFLPWRGLYVQQVNASRRRFETTPHRTRALSLPDREARQAGQQLVRTTGEPVELRRHEP